MPPTFRKCSNGARNTQTPDLLQHLLNPRVEAPACILLPRILIQILLHLRHARVRLGAEPQLNLDQGLEAGVEVRHAEVDELGDLLLELIVEGLVGGAGHLGLFLGARQLRHVLVRLLGQPLDFGAQAVVVRQLMLSLLHALVDVREVGAEAGYGLQDAFPKGLVNCALRCCLR